MQEPIDDFSALKRLVDTPMYIRSLVKALLWIGKVLPVFRYLGERVSGFRRGSCSVLLV